MNLASSNVVLFNSSCFKVNQKTPDDDDWPPWNRDTSTVIKIMVSAVMRWRLLDGSKERVGGSKDRAVYMYAFSSRFMTLRFAGCVRAASLQRGD